MASHVASGELHLEEVSTTLIDAGMRMASEPGRQPWTRQQIEAKVGRALADGLSSRYKPTTGLGTQMPAANGTTELPALHDRRISA